MAKLLLLVAGLTLAIATTLATGLAGVGAGHARPVSSPSFACAGYGNWGICVGAPTKVQ